MKTKSTLFCLVFALCTNTFITVYAQAVNKQDSLALVDLYNSTDGPNWVDHTNWLTNHPLRTWYGITVTGNRVTGLNLNVNNLNGTISPSIGNLVKLTYLYVGLNQLRGSIPSSIGNLVNVDDLTMDGNELSGSLPSSMGNLKNLTYLALNDNQLNSLPNSIGNLQNLQYLSASSNQLSGSIPSSIGNCKNLGWLNLSYNQLTSIPSSIGNAKSLYHLDLTNNKLSGTIPASIGNLVNLGDLYLSNNQLSGNIPSSLGNLLKLVYMYLDNNQLSGNIPFSIGNLGDGIISIMNLNHNKLSGKIPSSFANLALALEVDIQYNHFTFDGLEMVARKLSNIYYDHQARIPVHQNGNALSVSAGGTLSHNSYKWFKATKTGRILITAITGDSVFHPSHQGVFFVRVTNSIATQLTLHSDTIHFAIPDEFAESASSENALQQNNNANLFLVYPNPAKDILHVRTNSKATLTLTDQSGKILFTRNINGSGSLNISDIAAGLYYLRNNNTGAVQKVIIAK